ncbi:unnamed protein product [Cylindrotheca closterium]|uniref:YqaJ viral recombinase domain-containing protein n=1 Tax=Cylindrotheca closterium TaxID=2856 RepID=A0AAD2FQS0_9STRA|nr:unnamed protein product [Cylindrotheca closterium]
MAGRSSQRKKKRGRKSPALSQPVAKSGWKPAKGRHRSIKESVAANEIESVSILPPASEGAPTMANVTLINGTQLILDPREFHQRTDQSMWLAMRKTLDVTASEFSPVLNNSFFTSREKLLDIKQGNVKPFSGNSAACKWGLKMEPLAFQQYVRVTGNTVNETGLHIMQEPESSRFFGASPDGLVVDANDQSEGLLEIKCLWGRRNQKELSIFEHCPNRFFDQIQGQLAICDREWCDLMIYIPPKGKSRNHCILRIPRDREYWSETMLPALKEFCDDVEKMPIEETATDS